MRGEVRGGILETTFRISRREPRVIDSFGCCKLCDAVCSECDVRLGITVDYWIALEYLWRISSPACNAYISIKYFYYIKIFLLLCSITILETLGLIILDILCV